jgi:hypothetical protein
MSKRGVLGVALVVSILVIALPILGGQQQTTADVIEDHFANFCLADGSADIDAIMADYHPNAVQITPTDVLVGRDDIRASFEGLIAAFGGCGLIPNHDATAVVGPYGYIQWEWPELGVIFGADTVYGSDTFVVKGGLIQLQTVSMVPVSVP